MVAYERDVQTFLHKSVQLLEAFPDASLSTKYKKLSDTQALITAKTQDPISGVLVKFRTDKTVDLGRLMVGCNRLSAVFANKTVEDSAANSTEDVAMTDADALSSVKTTRANDSQNLPKEIVPTDDAKASSTNKKKKKKGKK